MENQTLLQKQDTSQIGKPNLFDDINRRFHKAYKRFLEDVEDCIAEAGGDDKLMVYVGAQGIYEISLEFQEAFFTQSHSTKG